MVREDEGDNNNNNNVVVQERQCRCRVVASPLLRSRACKDKRAMALVGFG